MVRQYLKMANSDKSNNTTIGKNILAFAKGKIFFVHTIYAIYQKF